MNDYRPQTTDHRLWNFLIGAVVYSLFAIVSVPAQAACCVVPSSTQGGQFTCNSIPDTSASSPCAGAKANGNCWDIQGCPQYGNPPKGCCVLPPLSGATESTCESNLTAAQCGIGTIAENTPCEQVAVCPQFSLPTSTPAGDGVVPGGKPVPVALTNPLGTTNVAVILGRLVAAMVGFAGAIGLIVVIYGGFQWLTAAGNPEKIKKGQEIMFWAIIGLVVMFGAYAATRYLIAALTQGRVLL